MTATQAAQPRIQLATLLERLPQGWGELRQPVNGLGDLGAITLTGVAEDSRRAQPGTLFLARAGRGSDGRRFIADALAAGAVAVVGEWPLAELPITLPPHVPYWQAPDGREAFALLSAAFFDFPSRKLTIIGVTGTDGKTTTSSLVHRMLLNAGIRAGLITTIAAIIDDRALDTGFHVTTPEAFDLQSYLAQMVAAGCTHAVVETTSHGLDQRRVAQVEYDIAAVTNVTHEHLDWHKTWENYMAAKARLFTALSEYPPKPGVAKVAILNHDDRSYPYLEHTKADRILTYSLAAPSATAPDVTCYASEIAITREGTSFTLHTPQGEQQVTLRLLGDYNVANALAAACVGLALGLTLPTIADGLGALDRVRGRMEWVYDGDFDVIVDFAHTPNALHETLRLARRLVRPGGRVVAVFGSAGLRDVEKRRMMGEIAAAQADFTVITAEDPRTEDVNAIIAEIAAGLLDAGKREGADADFIRVADRAEAIATAIQLARPNDLLVTCGKAHEQSMCYGTDETPWDEFAAVKAGLAARGIVV